MYLLLLNVALRTPTHRPEARLIALSLIAGAMSVYVWGVSQLVRKRSLRCFPRPECVREPRAGESMLFGWLTVFYLLGLFGFHWVYYHHPDPVPTLTVGVFLSYFFPLVCMTTGPESAVLKLVRDDGA